MDEMRDAVKVRIYGDSIMKVVTPAEGFRYHSIATPLIDACVRRFGLEIVNRSRFGSTVKQGYERLVADITRGERSDYVLLEYGGNDCDYDWEDVSASPEDRHDPRTPLDDFLKTYSLMIDTVTEAGMEPVLMTLPPLDAQRYLAYISRTGFDVDNIVRWLGDAQMIYRFQELYSDAVKGLAFKRGLSLIDIRERFLDKHNYGDLISADGVHPSKAGYELVFDTIGDYIAVRRPAEA